MGNYSRLICGEIDTLLAEKRAHDYLSYVSDVTNDIEARVTGQGLDILRKEAEIMAVDCIGRQLETEEYLGLIATFASEGEQ